MHRREPGPVPEGGSHALLGGRVFSIDRGFEYRGRFLRASEGSHVGVTFFSHMLALWRGRIALYRDGRELVSTRDIPEAGKWYRFIIRYDAEHRIRVRIWADGTSEPEAWLLETVDASQTPGHIGLWSLGGAAYFDDLAVTAHNEEEADTHAPTIVFRESGEPVDGSFNRDVRIEVAAVDVSGVASLAVTLDGQPYTSGSVISAEGKHLLRAMARDNKGNEGEATLDLVIDKTRPVITISVPAITNGNVTPVIEVNEPATVAVTLNGMTYSNTVITEERAHELIAIATDTAGNESTQGATFLIDRTPPVIEITAPQQDAELGTRAVVVSGTCGDAVRVLVNGIATTCTNGAFSATITLADGSNDIVVIAHDAANNEARASRRVTLDTRGPSLTVASLGECISANEVTLRGTVAKATRVIVRIGDATHDATISGNEWSAIVPVGEGNVFAQLEASDDAGRKSSASVSFTVDRIKPVLTATEDGIAFTRTIANRGLTPFVRVSDADANVTFVLTLNGEPYATGTTITAERTHVLRATATDCAGNTATFEHTFTIDRTPPAIVTITPANGATVATTPSLTGTLSEPATLAVENTNFTATTTGVSFSLDVPLEEGTNDVPLIATDAAGNVARTSYALRVKPSGPIVEIVESGLPIPANALFNRAVTPIVRTSDAANTITTALNGQPYTIGNAITADGAYTLTAKASDAFGRESDSAVATFSIDRTPPHITITAPANDAVTPHAEIEVRGTVDADARAVTVNGVDATLTGTTFVATVRLEEGANVLAATATDRAGNARRTRVVVTRNAGRLAILLTAPPDGLLTNRPATLVAGQVILDPPSGRVRVGNEELPVDATGAFRKRDYALVEGENDIIAEVTGPTGATNRVSITVSADFTPPQLTVTANGTALGEGARFAVAPRLAFASADPITLTIDGAPMTAELPPLADGAHTLTAIARDAAGNETRIDRTFFIGASASTAGCALTDFDPKDGSAVFTERVRIGGRSGGASGVLINGLAATVAGGTFCGEATLAPGRNEITIRCANANDPPVTLVLSRDVEPSIVITGTTRTGSTVTVRGTVSEGVVSGDVNGLAFTPANGQFTVTDVALTPGLNVITARARTSSGRIAVATTRVVHAGSPQVAITSPLPGTETGAATIDVTGTYVHADAVHVNGVAATIARVTDTSGTFAATVPLTAETTITATASTATASVTVRKIVGAPSISITTPHDNANVGGVVQVSGTFAAADGAQILVNGTPATINGNAFSATIDATTPILARVTEPDGDDATDAIRITRLAPLQVRDTFPTANATTVDRGAALLVLFNRVVTDPANALRLTDANGANVEGQLFVDRDAITFAPLAPLRAGETYTLTTSLVAPAHELRFTTAATAPAAPPLLDEVETEGCMSSIVLTGRATPNARVRLESGGVTLHASANSTGAFRFTLPLSGQPGFHLVRVWELGQDGSRSADRALCFRVNCELPRVTSASLDRHARKLVLEFSRPIDPSTLVAAPDGTIVVIPETTTALTGSVACENTTATITFSEELPPLRITVTVKKEIRDTSGAAMAADYTQTFHPDTTQSGQGSGYVTGAVHDATNGRPLANATITIGEATLTTNDRGRYSRVLPEGAWTIEARADGYTSAWRQVVVPAGAGVVPLDIRLARRNTTLAHGGDTSITKPIALTTGATAARLTSLGAQSLPGLLPLGWSPLAAAEVLVNDDLDAPLTATLTFDVDANAVRNANQSLTLARYDRVRDAWITIVAVAGDAALPITEAGYYALVYPDAAPHLQRPAPARTNTALQGVTNRCALPETCALTGRSFTLEPRAILPSGRAVATLVTEGATQPYPSGTAVQATIDEQLNLADGRTISDPPFATDLLVYRTLDGNAAIADFHLAPTPQAATVMLRDGVERVRIVDYPGRLDRGTLIGAEGGRVPGDGGVTIDIPTGATFEPLRASATTMSADDLAAFGSIAGFRIAAGFTLALTRTTTVNADDVLPPSLAIPARATFHIAGTAEQVVIVEVRSQTAFGTHHQLVAIAEAEGSRFTTRTIDSTQLPLDGIVRDGRYLVLVADAPIAFTFGTVRANDVALGNTRVSSGLGITSITSAGGVFVLPVPAKPAAPFTLVARSLAMGDGAPATAATAPDKNAFVDFGVLVLTAQSPKLQSVTPNEGELDVAAPFLVRATFDMAIDSTSVSGAITVTNLTTGRAMSGTVTAAANVVTFHPGEPLRPASQHAITINGTIRGTNGAPFGQTISRAFTTSARPHGSTSFHPERIRLFIPDANGVSRISGAAGSVPAQSQVVAVRRGRFFVETYQATVASDGAFSFDIGTDARDRVSIDDLIDLQVIDPVSRAITAIFELTPFVAHDQRGFIARHDRTTRFVSDEGIAVTVPKGAFEAPTFVAVRASDKHALAGVPRLDDELHVAATFALTFDGVAREPLEVELPANGADPNREWLIAQRNDSSRGPRLMIVDLAYVQNGTFHSGVASSNPARRLTPNAAITGSALRKYFIGVVRSATYTVIDVKTADGAKLGWGVMTGLQHAYDYFFSQLEALHAAWFYLAEKRGTIAIPVLIGRQFTITGVDAATGLDAFTHTYDPVAEAGAVPLANPNPDRTGPYPVFASPFRIETLDVAVADVPLTSIRDFTVELHNGIITATSSIGRTMLNATRGTVDTLPGDGLRLEGAAGDRIILFAKEENVDPHTAFSVTFDEPLDTTDLASLFTLETSPGATTPYVRITGALRITTDSGGRRIHLQPPASLTRGNRYRLAISPNVRNTSGLSIGQQLHANGTITGGLTEPLYLELTVRKPGDAITSFEIAEGHIRDQALLGNVLLIAAGEGGITAYDVGNPAVMKKTDTHDPQLRTASGAADYWALATDHHNRVFATGLTGLFGVLHSYRLEQFVPALTPDLPKVEPLAGATLSWAPGAAGGLQVLSRLLGSDRVEAYPRRVQIVTQDSDITVANRDFTQMNGVTVLASNGDLFTVSIRRDPLHPYLTQRITIENTTLGLRWSADATHSTPARIDGIFAREGDTLRILYNLTTYAVVSLFGYGIGVYDVNAIESNDVAGKPASYRKLREQIRLTNAATRASCPEVEPFSIPDLTFSPDAVIVSRPTSTIPTEEGSIKVDATDLFVYALDGARGVLDLQIDTPDDKTETQLPSDAVAPCDERMPIGLVFRNQYFDGGTTQLHEHPHLKKLRESFAHLAQREPAARFNSAARHSWSLAAKRNDGQRGSQPGTDVRREYMLIAGDEYGLLVVEIDGTPPPAIPTHVPLHPLHLVDVIWIPDGAAAVRVMPGSNLASVVDGRGHVLLVDLSRIDERWDLDTGALFPTVSAALAPFVSGEAPPATGIGRPDPRIVWKSARPLGFGTLAPVVDPDTGFLYAGKRLGTETTVIAALDPKLTVTDAAGETELRGIVPLGIAPPPALSGRTLGAFRVGVQLPGGIDKALAAESLTLAIDSERVAGAKTEDTPQGWPRAHLADVAMRRVLPDGVPSLRYQRAWNRWRSEPIVAIADPRAAKSYGGTPPDCTACTHALENAKEIFSAGHAFRIRVAPLLFTNDASGFAYLGTDARLETRIPTIPADTVRAPRVRVAAQMPPVANGALQETTYLHSGELETSAIDIDAGGRAGWNVAIDRTYRSRSIGLTPLGAGWDASMFRRLRELPNGDVEYRDGGGEIWLFARRNGAYVAPDGLYLRLSAHDGGWTLSDQQWRQTRFDALGRILSESDEWSSSDTTGNTIRYLYDASGRLAAIVDPVGRSTTLTWNAEGLVASITDWRGRRLEYRHDAQRRLTSVLLPEVANTSNQRPRIDYRYAPSNVTFKNELETATNLAAIVDPVEALTNGLARVAFEYDGDRITKQTWGTGESATFSYPDETHATVTDVLGQQRHYTLTAGERPQIAELHEPDVEVWSGANFGKLPVFTPAPGAPEMTTRTRIFRFTYANGALQSSTLDGVSTTTNSFAAPAGAPGVVLNASTTAPATPELGPQISRSLLYQTTANGSTFLRAVEAGGKQIEMPEAHRNNSAPSSSNDSIAATEKFDATGLLVESSSSGGTDAASAGANASVEYWPATAPPHKRAMPRLIRSGELTTWLEYPTPTQTRETDPRNVITTTDVDAWLRPARVTVQRAGDALTLDRRYDYDATGRLHRITEMQNGTQVVTTYGYDVMGRRTSVSTHPVATVGSVTESTAYDLPQRKIVTSHSSGAITTTDLDSLGRVKRNFVFTGSSPIEQRFAYDLAGNRVFVTDMQTASAAAFDAHGRQVAALAADGTVSEKSYDELHRPVGVKNLADDRSAVVAQSSYSFSDAGRVQSIESKIDAASKRTTSFAWDGGGRTTAVATNGRASKSKFDIAGRFLGNMQGAGDVTAVSEVIEQSKVTAHSGALPVATTTHEKNGTYAATMERNTAGDVVRDSVGDLEWTRRFDELGHVTRASEPSRPETKWDVDPRGAVTAETLPDGAVNRYAYDAAGASTNYVDPVNEPTSTTTDFIGRPLTRTYVDNTTEHFEYDGARLKSYTDRQNRKRSYVYNAKGQLEQIRDSDGATLDYLRYDHAGRLTSWRTADAELTWSDFTLDGKPQRTTQKRFKDASGFTTAIVLNEFAQEHRWNEHGERTRFSMPGADWWLRETRDAMGNVTEIARLAGDTATPLMTATHRAAGRPDTRTLFTSGGATITRSYAYDPQTSQLARVEVTSNGVPVAGSAVTYDGLQVAAAQLLGVSGGERSSRWSYDARGRVAASVYGITGPAELSPVLPGRAREVLTPADFRTSQQRTSRFTPPAPPVNTTAIDPPPSTFTEQPGHKIATFTQGDVTRPFGWNGAERVSDGRFTYTFDAKGRLLTATAAPLQIRYVYSATDRLIARRVTSDSTVVSDTTYVWDPFSDRLLAAFDTATGAVLEQVIHGDAAYDDPLIVLAPSSELYPIFDEAATSTLQAVLDPNGHLVSRNLQNDPYGADDLTLTGPAVDRVAIDIAASGTVTVSLHTTDPLDPTTVPTGATLTAGAVASPVPPTLTSPHLITWTFTPTAWTAFTTPATPLAIAATATLRSTTWSPTTLILPPPDWASTTHDLRTTPTTPFELRVPVPTASTTAYAIEHLALAASEPDAPLFTTAAFQALPFSEPATGLVYARARWYDASTGSFISPDPQGYVDSSNLYAFGGGDPVNGRDPRGEAILINPKVARDFLRGAGESATSVVGFLVGVGASAIDTVNGLNPVVSNYRSTTAAVPRTQRVAAAYRNGGTGAAARQYLAEVRDHATGVVLGLPIVNTVRQATAIPETYEAGSFEGGRQVGRTTLSAAGDVTIVFGAAKRVQQMRAQTPPPTRAPDLAASVPAAGGAPRAYNISTAGLTPAEAAAVHEYAQRTNAWLRQAGPQTIQSTQGQLRSLANAAARRERLRAARAGQPYQGQAGHVPDTAITGQAVPPAGWLDMPGVSNQCCGGGLASRIGQQVDIITVNGVVP